MEVIFDKMSISLASCIDSIEIRSFINSEWKERHILARDQNFFIYEHHNKDQINFVISKNSNGRINGVLGFIPSALGEVSDVCTVIWKVSKNSQNPILGIQLLQYLNNNINIRTLLSVGINKKTIGIYKYLGFFTGRLKHYVLLNKNIQEFKIGKIPDLKFSNIIYSGVEDLNFAKYIKNESDLLSFQFEKYKHNIPYKNRAYFIKRYFQHPIYQYDVVGIYNSKSLIGVFVMRVQAYNGAKILRIVDFVGEETSIHCFGKFILETIKKEGYEYADFYCFGLDNKVLNNAGFSLVDSFEEDVIIPNYFYPFLQKNISIYFFADTKNIKYLNLFKGDGDQDRPN